jgi:hypothetical protein
MNCIICGESCNQKFYNGKKFRCNDDICKKIYSQISNYDLEYFDALDGLDGLDDYRCLKLLDDGTIIEQEYLVVYIDYKSNYIYGCETTDSMNLYMIEKFYEINQENDTDAEDIAKYFISNLNKDYFNYINKLPIIKTNVNELYVRPKRNKIEIGSHYEFPFLTKIYRKPDLSWVKAIRDELIILDKIKKAVTRTDKINRVIELGIHRGVKYCFPQIFNKLTLTKYKYK